jgi:hypothetical protein
LQYQSCAPLNLDGSVHIPLSVEALYGYMFGMVHGKYVSHSMLTARSTVDVNAEPYINAIRSSALSISTSTTYSRATELSRGSLSNCRVESFSALVASSSNLIRIENADAVEIDASVRSETDPQNIADCGINSPANTWTYLPAAFTPMPYPLQKCCAYACDALLTTIGTSPTALTREVCCGACNKNSCGTDPIAVSAVALYSVLHVPALLNANVTTISFNLNFP